MTCSHCGGRHFVQASLVKGDQKRTGLVPYDLLNFTTLVKVKLDGESGWFVDVFWTSQTYWEHDLEFYDPDKLRQILNVEREIDD